MYGTVQTMFFASGFRNAKTTANRQVNTTGMINYTIGTHVHALI